MALRSFVLFALLILASLGVTAGLQAQLESADRGIAPIDSSGTLEVTGVHVDVGGENAQAARFAGWRMAQREGFRKLWAATHKLPISQAPNLPDSTLDGLVSSIIIEREQIGPNRYIADLGILFDRAKAGGMLGIGGEGQRSAPMLLIPVTVSGGTATSVELKNAWQRAWAQFRTSQSPVDYVRVSGMGVDPLLINAAQTERRGRAAWRNIVDLYGAADILVAEVNLHRAFPGGPARGRFSAWHGPDRAFLGSFELTATTGDVQALMNAGVQRMDQLFQRAFAAGLLVRDPSLDLPPPPPLPEELVEANETRTTDTAQNQAEVRAVEYQVQVVSPDANTFNFAMAHLRTLGGLENAQVVLVNIGGISYAHVSFRGSLAQLGAAMGARGWNVETLGPVIRVSGNAGPPPPRPAPAPSQPVSPATPPAQSPAQPAPTTSAPQGTTGTQQ